MDNLKTLFDKKQYDLILKITEKADDDTTLFYRISAFMALNKIKEAIDCINTNQKILEKRLPWLMKLHIELLCLNKQFDEAYEKVKYYESLPYFSQEGEEVLSELPNLVRKMEMESHAFMGASEEELRENLKSKDENVVIASLDTLREKDLSFYFEEISYILVNFPKQLVRSFALLLLVQKQVNQEFKFKSRDTVITVNPSKLLPPFVGNKFNKLVTLMSNSFMDPSISSTSIKILSTYLIYIYPTSVDFDDPNLLEALYLLSIEYLHIDSQQPRKKPNIDIDENKVRYYINELRSSNEND